MSATAAPRLFYGWWLIAAVFVGEMLAIGSTTYAFGLFVKPLQDEFGISRGDAYKGIALLIIGMGLSGPLIGRLLDRRSARRVMAFGAAWMAAGFVAVALAPTLGWMALATLLMVASGAFLSFFTFATPLLIHWVSKKYVVELMYNKIDDSYTAITYSLLLRKKEVKHLYNIFSI